MLLYGDSAAYRGGADTQAGDSWSRPGATADYQRRGDRSERGNVSAKIILVS